MQNLYDLVLILRPKADDIKEKKLGDLLKKYAKDEIKIKSAENLGKKTLTYPIKKETEGIYWLVKLDMDGKEVPLLNSKFKLDDIIMRYMFIKVDDVAKKPATKAKKEIKEK